MNRYWICIPVFNDWESVSEIVRRINLVVPKMAAEVCVLIVDDASSASASSTFTNSEDHVERLDILRLRRNIGHQRAIAVGLAYIEQHERYDGLIVMDGDGEDKPEDLPVLVSRFERNDLTASVFAKRGRRTDGPLFYALYHAYKLAHLFLTGRRVEVGNFSVLPKAHVESLLGDPDLWNHYAATVMRAELPADTVTLDRGHRIAGRSKMSVPSLIAHGIKALAVYARRIGGRLLFGGGVILAASLACIRLSNEWAPAAGIVVGSIGVVFGLGGLVLLRIARNKRTRLGFVPRRDCPAFVSNVTEIRAKT